MSEVTSPIVLADGWDVFVFATTDAALAWLEPSDVLDARYIAFDSAGKQLALEASSDDSSRMAQGQMSMRITADDEATRRQMVQTLRVYLHSRGIEPTGDEDLVDLIAAVDRWNLEHG